MLNVFTMGDGLWYWYGVLVQGGSRVYTDLHLNLQPLFVLLSSGSLRLFGHSWFGIRAFPLLQVLLFSVGLFLVSRRVPWRDPYRALLILAAFGMTMTIPYYRFDDFHVTTQIFQVYSLWLLLLLDQAPSKQRGLVIAVALGLLSGLSISNRLNDGVALFGACAIALFGSAAKNRLASTLVFCLAAAAAFLLVLRCTGDTMSAWFHYSVVLAAQIKSGSGHLWQYPLLLPFRTLWRFLKSPLSMRPLVYCALIIGCIVFAPAWVRKLSGKRRLAALTVCGIVGCGALVMFGKNVLLGVVNPTLADTAVPFTYVLFVVLMVRFGRELLGADNTTRWHARELLLLVPMLQLFLAAVTGGAGETEASPAMALTLLLLPIVSPVPFAARARQAVAILAALVALAAFPFKYLHPFLWHDYSANTMFLDRTWYHHPSFGLMYVDNNALAIMVPLCKTLQQDPGSGLLSMPYPHANYFCNMPPWKGYVQTWYDTSSKPTIDALASQLRTDPPTWIEYERSLTNISAHEVVYNGNRPLAHRQLDTLLLQRLAERRWTLVQRGCNGGADWLLVRTTPPRFGEYSDFPVLMNKTIELCSRSRNM